MFPNLPPTRDLQFSTKDLDICDRQLAEIYPETWHDVVPHVKELVIEAPNPETPTSDGGTTQPPNVSSVQTPPTMIPPFVRKAGPPFDNEGADVVLRSADGVDFYFLKAHLSSASEVFNHMFSSPQPSEPANEAEELADVLPIVPIYDPSPVLKALLCYCDPNITWRSNSVIIDILNLAMKYDMTPVIKAIYRDRIQLERELPPSRMLDTIRQRVGQNEDIYLAAANIFTPPEDETIDGGSWPSQPSAV